MATTLVDVCAYAGTGNVLKIQVRLCPTNEFYYFCGSFSHLRYVVVCLFQNLLHICSEHYEPAAEKEDSKDSSKKKDDKKKDDKKEDKDGKKDGEKKEEEEKPDLSMQQSVAVIGLALVAMGEDIGSEMLFRY